MDPIPAIHQSAEESEQALIERAQQAVSHSAWVIGECASKWTEQYARGRGDADFAELVGMSTDQIRQRRNVYEKMSYLSTEFHRLSWSHFYAALNWDDAETYLRWACDMGATVREMRSYRNVVTGDNQIIEDESPKISDTYPKFDEPEPQVEPEAEPDPKPDPPATNQERQPAKPKTDPEPEPPLLPPDPHTEAVKRVLNVAEAISAVQQLAGVAIESYDPDQREELALALIEQARLLAPDLLPRKERPPKVGVTAMQIVVDEWNMLGEPFPRCASLTEKRRASLKMRLSDPEFKANWRQALNKIPSTPFLRGENDRGWIADFDWFIKPDSVVKILEGKYVSAATGNDAVFDKVFGTGWRRPEPF